MKPRYLWAEWTGVDFSDLLFESNERKVIFTSLHGMQAPYSNENSVRLPVCPSVCPSACLSVCLSNAWIVTKRKKDLSRFLYHTKDHLAWFSKKKNGWWGATPSTWNFGSTGPCWSEIADFRPIFARSATAATPSEKKFN